MDIATGLGLAAGIIVVATMVLMGGDLHMFISEHAIIIIFGGSFAATLIRLPLDHHRTSEKNCSNSPRSSSGGPSRPSLMTGVAR